MLVFGTSKTSEEYYFIYVLFCWKKTNKGNYLLNLLQISVRGRKNCDNFKQRATERRSKVESFVVWVCWQTQSYSKITYIHILKANENLVLNSKVFLYDIKYLWLNKQQSKFKKKDS